LLLVFVTAGVNLDYINEPQLLQAFFQNAKMAEFFVRISL